MTNLIFKETKEQKALRNKLSKRFYATYQTGERLLAIQLGYIEHKIYFDYGKNTKIYLEQVSEFLHFIEKDNSFTKRAEKVLRNISHQDYKKRAIQIIYLTLEQRK